MANVATLSPSPNQIFVTLEPDAIVADIKKALKLMRGVASVRTVKVKADNNKYSTRPFWGTLMI